TALAVLLGALLVAALVVGSVVVRRLQAAQRRVRELEARLDREHELKAESAQASRRLRRALGAIAHGVVIFDEHGEVVYRNNPATSFLAARHGDALVEEAISAL